MGGGHETDHPIAGVVFLGVMAVLLGVAATAGIKSSREATVRKVREQIVELGDSGATAQAEALAAELAEAHPDNPRVLFLLGRLQLETGKLEEADANFGRVFALEPGNWDA